MFLKRFYSTPNNIFPIIEFHDGVNFIYGKKEHGDDPKTSLNGIGKSTLLDLIDFCLFSSFDKFRSPRLFSAKELIDKHSFTLEFEVDGLYYQITRSIAEPSKILFGEIGQEPQELTVKEAQQKMCDLVFKNEEYEGKYSNKWFRKLIPFFVKIQRIKKEKFIDPISYTPESSVSELNQYHLFFLGIDNSLTKSNYEIQCELKKKKPAIAELKKIIEETYGLKNISEVFTQITNIKTEVGTLEKALGTFKLDPVYNSAEVDVNSLTSKIKDILQKNILDRKRIFEYQESYRNKGEIDVAKVSKVYKELSESLSIAVKKTLNDAINFRESLSRSRQDFIKKEIENIQKNVTNREKEMRSLEGKRVEIFSFLQAKEALKDLTEGFNSIGKKKQVLSDLEGKVKVFEDFKREEAELKIEESKLERQALDFISEIRGEIEAFRKVVSEVYNAIYPASKDKSIFDILLEENSQSKLKITVEVPAMFSKGKNQGRTLVYDLSVLINGIRSGIRFPRFLIHDGIFDGIDKGHFVALYHYLEKLTSEGFRFQYIVTLNEEGTLNEKFGDNDQMIEKQIEDKSVIKLSGNNKLLKDTF